jgi:hypothetical protein
VRTCVFLLSPSRCTGRRAAILLRPESEAATARRLAGGELTLGETFSFLSGLYFRGKLAYGRAFGRGDSSPSTLVITPTRGLMSPDAIVDRSLLEEFAGIDIDADNLAYRTPLERDAAELRSRTGEDTPVVLLGSVATGKYVDVLAPIFGDRLLYPSAFVGRGDMSRGGLLLRHVASGEELDYAQLSSGTRIRGPRPPRLLPTRGLDVRTLSR